MTDKTFRRLLTAVLIAGIVTTLALAVYTAAAYQHSSIIPFIGKEWW